MSTLCEVHVVASSSCMLLLCVISPGIDIRVWKPFFFFYLFRQPFTKWHPLKFHFPFGSCRRTKFYCRRKWIAYFALNKTHFVDQNTHTHSNKNSRLLSKYILFWTFVSLIWLRMRTDRCDGVWGGKNRTKKKNRTDPPLGEMLRVDVMLCGGS